VRETLALGDRAHNQTIRCVCEAILAQTYCLRGDYARAKVHAEAGLRIGEEIGNLNVLPAAASAAIIAYTELGEPFDPARYVESLEQGLASPGFLQLNQRFVAEALMGIGNLARAAHHVEAMYGALGGRLREALIAVAMGDVRQRQGRLGEATEAYERGRSLALEVGARSALVGASLGLAEVALASGETPDADDLARAQRLSDELKLGRYADRLARATMPPALACVAT
jgi:tetratricopeptide (TPR) repeat protein